MPKVKTRKSISKRFKMTKGGKILRRPTGLDHFRAKKSGKEVRKSRKWIPLNPSEKKRVKRMIVF
ncbi:MAG: 50S ribosomal protein L35 [Candidatus Pacebacteria bacterium]|nr:50S ribosomal protein L35 [Candidatus Paceibacterota bacterium]